MKKIFSIISILFLLSCVFAKDDILFFNVHYSNEFSAIDSTNLYSGAIGGGVYTFGKVLESYMFAKIGFQKYITSHFDMELKGVDFTNVNLTSYSLPMSFGYPFQINITGTSKCIIPLSFDYDLVFSNGKFDTFISENRIKFDVSTFGMIMGFGTGIGMMHNINNIYFRYGVDFSIPIFGYTAVSANYSGYSSGSTSDFQLYTIAKYFIFKVTPYLGVGFKL